MKYIKLNLLNCFDRQSLHTWTAYGWFTTHVAHRSSLELDHACCPSLSFHSYPMIDQLDVFLQCRELG